MTSFRFYYDGYVQLLVDIDGIRIFTNEVCDFLQKVPGSFHWYERALAHLIWIYRCDGRSL